MNELQSTYDPADRHLQAAELEMLLDGDAADRSSGSELHSAARHVETCETCRAKLTTLAAGDAWWSEARSMLRGDEDGCLDSRWEPDSSVLSTLSPPSSSAAPPRASTQHSSAHPATHDARAETALLAGFLDAPSHPELLGRLGRYDIERVIGAGGMGIVLKAHDSELNRPVAIKVLAAHLAHVGAARGRFAREGRAAAAVVHEHVMAIYNVETGGRLPFLVMQYVPGCSLQGRVDRDGPLHAEEILRIGMQAAAGLAAAHQQGLVHRDVKPSNILLEESVERAILTDFGLARAIDDASLTQTGVVAGTPHYMAPEQATGGPIDHRADLFSLGAVLYFMATGGPPFRGPGAMAVLHRICREPHRPVWERNKDIPDELADVIDRLLEKKPARRYESAEQVRQELARVLSRLQEYGPGRRRWQRRWRGWRSKPFRRSVIALGTAVVVMGAVLVVAALLSTGSVEEAGNTPSVEAQQFVTEPGAEAAADSADAIGSLLQLAGDERQFARELAELQEAVPEGADETFYLQNFNDPWPGEVQAIGQALDRLESPAGGVTTP